MKCVMCQSGPLGANNASGYCERCRRKHYCPICRSFQRSRLGRELCDGCRRLAGELKALRPYGKVRPPLEDRPGLVTMYAERASALLPLFEGRLG